MRRLLGLVLIVMLSACGSEDAPAAGPSGHSAEREHEVAGDPDATVEEIVDAGRPSRIAMSGSGLRLVSYLVESDDDEGPQASAWRLYDGARVVAQGPGTRVSEANASPGLWGLDDGFLLQRDPNGRRYEVVAADGTVTVATTSRTAQPVEPGDVQIGDGSTTVFRPATATVFAAPSSPAGRQQQGQAVDASGGVWVLGSWRDALPVLHSADGGTTWEREQVPLPAGGYPLGVEVAGDRVVIPVGSSGGDTERLVSLQVREVAGAGWTEVPADVDDEGYWSGAEVAELPDGRLLVSDWDGQVYAAPLDGGDWAALPLPDDTDGWSVQADGDLLHALNWRQATAYVSDDLGESWAALPR